MADLLIYGEIGWDVQASSVVREIHDLGGADLTLRVNSPGGDVYEGLAIMNALRAHKGTVTAVVEGLAASAASFIAVGGADRVVMRPTAEVMVHEAMSFVGGNAEDMTKAIADLDRISANLAGIYADKAGGDPGEWRERMKAETWFSAEEAVDAGLADAVEDGRTVEARHGRPVVTAQFRYQGRRAAPTPTVNRPEGHDRKEGGMSALADLAQEMGLSEDQVKAAFARVVLNEEVTVTSTVDVAYPEGTTVVPTGKATIAPVEEVPQGLTFTVGEAPEGWTAEVDEVTGSLSVTAPAGAEPDDEVELTVTVAGNDAPVDIPVVVTVTAAAGDEEETETGPQEPAGDPDRVVLDRDTYNDLQAAAKLGWEAKNKADAAARVAEVDRWISEGRVNAARRSKVIAAMEKDPVAARDLYGSIPKSTIPRGEIGHGQDNEDAAGKSSSDLTAKLDKARILSAPNVY
ncbi:head maturation protease, ClpP-related [Corynebacterium sp. AOP34-AQ2-28]|uniref:head maturation protease, ClpP-related n=1 Tax=Corynebacterium sp. AOP34-AQ2-28 TaxID=3457689 RepID=UPI0040333DE8